MSSKFYISSKSNKFRPKLGPIIKRALEANGELLSQHNIKLGEYLGAGYAGCVYQYDKNTVIKFTSNINEVQLAKFIMNFPEKIEGFPTIYDITEIVIPKFKTIYAILKEDILTMAIPDEVVKNANYLCEVVDPKVDPYINEEAIMIAVENLITDKNLFEISQMYYGFADFLVWCIYNGIYIYDVIDINLGFRISPSKITLVVRDFSACQVF